MPNLVGIGNSQVPTNAMLGGLAYQDSVGEIDIEKIKALISGTVVDVFVYDTRKDSDGGAWRHRTQNKSWYNEGVSAKRGARKEFPAVAVIVTAYESLTIYDGDDPNLPMWMEFDYGSAGSLSNITMLYANGKGVSALNGVICSIGGASWHDGLTAIDFIADNAKWRNSAYIANWSNGIANRNVAGGYRPFVTAPNEIIASAQVNEVAMTVRPNAPIDASTGLPIPTIVLATDGGTSLIKDNGSVIDLNDALGSTRPVRHAIIRGDDILHYNINNGTIQQFFDAFSLTADSTNDVRYNYTEIGGAAVAENMSALLRNSGDGPFKLATINPKSFAAAAQSGVSIFVDGVARAYSTDNNSIFDSRVAYITSNYNTGYMFGDIRGALLSDTDTTNISDTQLITNNDYTNGITGWTIDLAGASGGSPGITVVSNKLRFQQGSLNSVWLSAYQDITTVVGKKYLLNIDIASSNTSANWRIYAGSTKVLGYPSNLNQGQHSNTFVATSTSTRINIQQGGSASTVGEVNSISVLLLEEDRSLKNNYVEINGTIHKNPVATGAELVSYSNFSDSKYLLQPYNSALNFGTGDLYIMFWANFTQNNAYDLIMARRAHNGSAYTGNGWYAEMGANNNITLKDSASGATRGVIDGDSTYDIWQHICFVRRNNVGYGYKNGILQSSTHTWNENLDNSSAVLTIGRNTASGGGDADKTRLALVRIGGTVAPSEEQINKIYNEEKCLFHENAKCTLHGTSDDVKALSFDDTNDVLHVGTSAGRSEFQGLNRINNTTTAVTTAISVSNEFVAEQ